MSEQLQNTSPQQEQGQFIHIREKLGGRLTWQNTARTIGAAALFAIPSAAVAGGIAYEMESQDATIASFDSTIHLANDGYATFDARPLGAARVPLHKPGSLGINVRLNQSLAPDTSVLVSEVGALVAQPKGETDKLSATTSQLLISVGETGAMGGLGGVVLFGAVGARRRRELAEKYGGTVPRIVLIGALAAACAASTATSPAAASPQDIKWQNIQDALPGVPNELADMGIQISSNVISNNTIDLVRGMIAGYERSTVEYKAMQQKASELGPELRQPRRGEVTILLMSDRHDNIGMDPVNAAIGKAGHADIVIDAGDDTSSGQPWEEFSLASLDANFKGFKNRIEINGNHDHGSFVSAYLSKAKNGFKILDHGSVTADGIRIMGFADIRSSTLVNSPSFADTNLSEYKKQIVKEACDANAAGKRAAIIVVHQASLAEDALRAGCADTVLGGHLHQYKGPTEFTGDNGDNGYSFTTDTAGGAALAMSLGPLRRSAGVTLITFDTNGPQPVLVGFQKVISTQEGDVIAQPFEPVGLGNADNPIPTRLKQEKKYPGSALVSEKRRTYTSSAANR